MVLALLIAALPASLVLLLFSQVSPLSPIVIDTLVETFPPAFGFAAAIATGLFIVALHWLGKTEKSPGILLLILALIAISSILLFPTFPCVVPAVLVLETPALLHALVRGTGEAPMDWFRRARGALLLPAIGALLLWTVFILSRVGELTKWTDWTPEFRERVINHQVSWKVAFVEWSTPLGISTELFILALLYHLQMQLAEKQAEAAEQQGKDTSVEDQYVISQVKLLGVVITMGAMILWIGAALDSIGGEDQDLGSPREDMRNEVLGLSFWVFAGLAVWLVYNLGGPEKVRTAATNSKVAQRVLELMHAEWARAGYLCCFAPFLLVYAVLVKCFSRPEASEEEVQMYTGGASQSSRKLLVTAKFYGAKFMAYLWMTPVITKAQLLAIFYVSCAVGVKVITLMLAYTNKALAPLDVYVVSGAIFLIGTFLFLLPPTPGPPVYALVGILVTESAINSGWSVAAALTWSVGIGFAIKMCFAAVAQKFIGEPFAASPTIRTLCQMHTTEIRAIAKILEEPGTTAAKVSILIGGPDWPVAVLCGMLRLPLCSIMLGLSPVLLQSVIPCVLSGSFLVLYAGDEDKKALGESALALAGALQMVALLLAGYFVQDTLERNFDELSIPRPEDQAAIDLETAAAEEAKSFEESTEFTKLPLHMKLFLVLGLVCGIVSCIVLAGPWKVLLGPDYAAFKKFEVTSNIDKVIGDNVFSIIRPMGWIAMLFCAVDAACLQIFQCWADRTAKAGYSAVSEGSQSA